MTDENNNDFKTYMCLICGFIYDEEAGWPDLVTQEEDAGRPEVVWSQEAVRRREGFEENQAGSTMRSGFLDHRGSCDTSRQLWTAEFVCDVR